VPFKGILQNLVERTPGATGAILADWEGESVEHFSLYDDYELKIIGAHKGIILNRVRELQQGGVAGEPREVLLSTDRAHIITGAIGKDYSLVMTLDSDAVVGRALYHFRQSVVELAKEIY